MEILGFKNKKSDLDFILGHASNRINFNIIKYLYYYYNDYI